MKAIVINEYGGPEVLTYTDLPRPKLGESDARVIHEAIAINHMDIHYRQGVLPVAGFPQVLGYEGIGFVEDAGKEIEHLNYNDRVIYATGPLGAYAEERAINPKYLVNVPADLNANELIAVYSKGLTAHYLLYRTFMVAPNHYVLIQGVTGALGQILCQWAKHKGATVIGTVSTEEKAALAKQLGCDEVVIYSKPGYVEKILACTNNTGVDVVYDLVGAATHKASLYSLTAYGMLVMVGMASGKVESIDTEILYEKCILVTCPRLEVYKMKREELVLSANEVFEALRKKIIAPRIYEYSFDEIPQAHQNISDRVVAGSSIVSFGSYTKKG